MMRRLVLLVDIDGTLMTLHGTGRTIFQQALHQQFGSGFNLQIPSFSGRTDWEIFLDTWNHHTRSNPDWHSSWLQFKSLFGNLHRQHLSKYKVHKIFPGVIEFLSRLPSNGTVLSGLLTGNIRTNAWQKVRLAGLHRHFRFGAYGDDHWQRELLGPVAVKRARRYGVNQLIDRVVLIGDSPRDMDVARYMGIESIGVVTGSHNKFELEKAGASLVVTSLTDSFRFLEIPVDNR